MKLIKKLEIFLKIKIFFLQDNFSQIEHNCFGFNLCKWLDLQENIPELTKLTHFEKQIYFQDEQQWFPKYDQSISNA